jgi:hypothetical protein
VPNHTQPTSDVFEAWTNAERDMWAAWSRGEQDLGQPAGATTCGHLMDACEASARQAIDLRSAIARGMSDALDANPLVPAPARTLLERAAEPIQLMADLERHVLAAWFGMARQVSATGAAPLPTRLHP